MKLHLVSDEGELFETWEKVEENVMLSPAAWRLLTLEIKQKIEALLKRKVVIERIR